MFPSMSIYKDLEQIYSHLTTFSNSWQFNQQLTRIIIIALGLSGLARFYQHFIRFINTWLEAYWHLDEIINISDVY